MVTHFLTGTQTGTPLSGQRSSRSFLNRRIIRAGRGMRANHSLYLAFSIHTISLLCLSISSHTRFTLWITCLSFLQSFFSIPSHTLFSCRVRDTCFWQSPLAWPVLLSWIGPSVEVWRVICCGRCTGVFSMSLLLSQRLVNACSARHPPLLQSSDQQAKLGAHGADLLVGGLHVAVGW